MAAMPRSCGDALYAPQIRGDAAVRRPETISTP